MTEETSEWIWIQDLPKVPVPDLHKTLERYLSALKPVIPVAQFEQTKRTVEDFLKPNGEGEALQALLQEYANETENWITELWMDDMYYLNPIPLPVNSSPFYMFGRQPFRTSTDQLKLAVRVIQFALQFNNRINNQSLTQDFGSGHGKGQPLCMQTYKHFFTAYRIPGEDKDELLLEDNFNKDSNHIIVASRNQFFALQFRRNEWPTEDVLFEKLKYIWSLSKEYESSAPLVGVLTTDNRKIWANTRKRMLLSEINKQSLKYLETCLFIICLDDCVSTKTVRSQRRDSVQMARMEPSYMASMLLHGGGTEFYTPNRWFDKFLQIVIGKDGIFGIICEHSASEGITVLRFCEQFLDYLEEHPYQNTSWLRKDSTKGMQFSIKNTNSFLSSNNGVLRLQWDIDSVIAAQIQDSIKRVDKLISDVDMYVLHFNEYGKDFIKQQKMSPDAYIQLALQLTYYKVHRKLVSTYESASIRQFKLGRVDNIRAATLEALAWAKAMCDEIPEITEKHKVDMFQKAIKKQMEILKYTITGFGPDNHLLGLKEISKMKLGETPLLFKEKSYKEFINFRLSTSQLPTETGILVGYGPVVPDGYGCSYNPCNQSIVFCISSFFSSAETSSDFFALSLEGSMLQMRELCIKLISYKTETKLHSGSQK